jgi:hypothetical protein
MINLLLCKLAQLTKWGCRWPSTAGVGPEIIVQMYTKENMATLEESIQVQVNTRSSLPPQELLQLTLKSGELLQFPDLKITDDPAKHRDAMGDGPIHIGDFTMFEVILSGRDAAVRN